MRQPSEQTLIDAIEAVLEFADSSGESLAAVHLSHALDAVGATGCKQARERWVDNMRDVKIAAA